MNQYETYRKAAEQEPKDKVDRILFQLELTLSGKCDRYSRVKYRDIFEEITAARIVIKSLKD